MGELNRKIILRVANLTKIYGPGCPNCVANTGPERNTSQCSECGSLVACADINFTLNQGEILGIVGESGSGKSTIIRSLYFDHDITSGQAYFPNYSKSLNAFELSLPKKRYLRNYMLGMVYQHPHLGLRLDFTAGGNIAEKILASDDYHIGRIRAKAGQLLQRTEVPLARMDDRPRHFSGGMQQRVQIAKAIANHPEIIFLDEVTSGLDVSVQAKVLDLIKQLQQELKMSMIVVSHDLGVIRLLADRTAVVKNGRIVEIGLTDQILEDPQHEYTQLLVSSLL